MAAGESEGSCVGQVLAQTVAGVDYGPMGFQNRTTIVTLESGRHGVLQRYRRREGAAYRLQAMGASAAPQSSHDPRPLEMRILQLKRD